MDGKQIYAQALAANVLLKLKDGALTFKAADGMPEDLRNLVREHKSEVVRYLMTFAGTAPGPSHERRISRLASRTDLPVSRAQQRLWLAGLQAAEGGHFNIQGCFLVEGSLDPLRVSEAIQQLAATHEPLRANFFEKDGHLCQVIRDEPEITIVIHDLSGLDSPTQPKALRELIEEDLWKPFDLEADPLLRVMVVCLTEDRALLVFNVHHIIADGWSVGLLVEQFVACYVGAGTPRNGGTPALQYGDFVAWQEAWLDSGSFDASLAFWRSYLDGIPEVHSLPLDRSRPSHSSSRGQRFCANIGPDLKQRIHDYCVARRITLFTFLETALAVLFAHLSDGDDIVIGTPVAGRTSPDVESMIGLFVNSIVLRTHVDLHTSFEEILESNKAGITAAFEHQDVPFDLIAEALKHRRSASYTPVFQLWFVLQNNREVELALPGCTISEYNDVPEPVAKYELNLYARERGGCIQLDWIFNTSVFQSESIEYVAGQFLALVDAVIVRPDIACIDHGMFASVQSYSRPLPVPDKVARLAVAGGVLRAVMRHVSERGQDAAVVTPEGTVTFAELADLAGSYGYAMRNHEGAPVALLFDRGASMVAAMLAALSSGTPYVALDPGYPSERLRFMVEDAGCAALVTHESHSAIAFEIAGRARVIKVAQGTEPMREADIAQSTTAYILYTSGSTGHPKGVFQTQEGLGYQAATYANELGLRPDDRLLQLASFSFDASVLDTYGALIAGASLHLADIRSSSQTEIRQRIADERITIFHSTPTVFRQLFSDMPVGTAPDVRLVVLGGEPVDDATTAVFQHHFSSDCRLVGLYGATESSLVALNMGCGVGGASGSLGHPVPGSDIAIRRNDGSPARIFEAGQLAVRSRYSARGYWGDNEKTSARFITTSTDDRVYLTGDTGYQLPDGTIRFTGRADFQVKLNGIRIETGEIEARLLQIDAIERAVVVMVADPPRLVAHVVPVADAAFPNDVLRAHAGSTLALRSRKLLSQWLPDYMIPGVFQVVDALPMSPSGKVDRRALASMSLNDLSASHYVAPRNATEKLLCALWCGVLGRDRVGIEDDFFMCGGTSLQVMQLCARFSEQTGQELAVSDVFSCPTVSSLADRLSGSGQPEQCGPQKVNTAVEHETHPLSAAQHRFWMLSQMEKGATRYNMPVALRLRGHLDLPAFQIAWDGLVSRHAVLRTTYGLMAGQVFQRVHEASPVRIETHDLASLDAAAQDGALVARAEWESTTPFDLACGPVYRVSLSRLSDDEHVLHLTLHHIAADGWSMGILVREFSALYAAALGGFDALLPKLPIQYFDYARWERNRETGPERARELSFWLRELAGLPVTHALPLDRPRPSRRGSRAGVVSTRIDRSLVDRLSGLAVARGATLFMVLHSALAALLTRWSGVDDVAIGTPLAGRSITASEGLIGCFVNTLVMRTRIEPGMTYNELLMASRESTLSAFKHGALPFDVLVDAIKPDRGASHTPLFQILFALQNYNKAPLELAGITVEEVVPASVDAKFDLSVIAVEDEHGAALNWVFSDDLFNSSTIRCMAEGFDIGLRHLAREPEGRISDIAWMPATAGVRPADAGIDAPSGRTDAGRSHVLHDEAIHEVRPARSRHALEAVMATIWRDLLALDDVAMDVNFFDVGGSSMLGILLRQEIMERTGIDLDVTDIFAYPTIAGLARHLSGEQLGAVQPVGAEAVDASEADCQDIAIIGMAGRFPGALDVDSLWLNIARGVESLDTFTDDEMLAFGVDKGLLSRADYVNSGVLLEGLDRFDASYFGLNPREAEVMDPQQRLLFEAASSAMESAGYGDASGPRHVGVFVGTGESRYLFDNLLPQAEMLQPVKVAAVHGNRPDYAATRLAYSLNLTGPALSVGTACSTSLVAVHMACASLRKGESDMALAGGSSVSLLGPQGYVYHEGSIASADGRCRAFDSEASGTRSGSGAGIVVLKRLQRALADGDTVHAVIRGSAINNDGSGKVGYTAPSLHGQARVIVEAHRAARVDPASIQYVEAHGTATALGDPIEVAALAHAFGPTKTQYCALGSIKPNIGHLDSAAGVAGLIKTVKALQARQLPPSIHFRHPNPRIDFANSPFYVNTELKHWPVGDSPRRAGVSSFGIGGTNAHVVLEEAPPAEAVDRNAEPTVLVVSARSADALDQATANLREFLADDRDECLADIAHTLQRGRTAHAYRRTLVASTKSEALNILDGKGAQGVASAHSPAGSRPSIVFMFSGQGTQYVDMSRDLYAWDPSFAETLGNTASLLLETSGIDALDVLFPDKGREEASAVALSRTEICQPVLFVLEYALASWLMRCGVRPDAVIGHSLGEYVAACIAGVFSLKDALRLVAERGRLMQRAPTGKMLSFKLPEKEATSLVLAAGCSLAAVNGPNDCVAAGTPHAVDELEHELTRRGIPSRELRTSHAFHSPMMESVAPPLRALLASMVIRTPTIPYVSNVTGGFITSSEVADPEYWVRHMLGTVRFSQGLATLSQNTQVLQPRCIYVEVGPGITLSTLARQHGSLDPASVMSSMRHMHDSQHDARTMLRLIGQLWLAGVDVAWASLHERHARRRVPLPTYPFERRRYWIDRSPRPLAQTPVPSSARPDDWFYTPVWTQVRMPPPVSTLAANGARIAWLVFGDHHGAGRAACTLIRELGMEPVYVLPADHFDRVDASSYTIRPDSDADYSRLLLETGLAGVERLRILHLWGLVDLGVFSDLERHFDHAQKLGFGSLVRLSRLLATDYPATKVIIDLVTDRAVAVTGEEAIGEAFSTSLGLLKVIPQEFPQMTAFHVDIDRNSPHASDFHALARCILAEILQVDRPVQVAYRGARRWLLSFEHREIEPPTSTDTVVGRSYVITGGLGRIGLALAGRLADEGAAGVMLVSRTELPARDSWLHLREEVDGKHVMELVDRIREVESAGARILTCVADVSDPVSMGEALDLAEREFGKVDVIVHCAGKVHDAMCAIGQLDDTNWQQHFVAKARGTRVLHEVSKGRGIESFVLMSSLSSVLGGLGFAAYAAANSYLDGFAHARNNEGDPRWMSVNWDGWSFSRPGTGKGRDAGMSPDHGSTAFLLASRMTHLPQLVNSATDLKLRIDQWLQRKVEATSDRTLHERPAVGTTYELPTGQTEADLVAIWQDLLGIDRIGVHDNFFELGGDSVLLVQAHRAVRERISPEVAIATLFQFPSIRELARFLDRDTSQREGGPIVNRRLERRRAISEWAREQQESAS